MIAPSRAAEAAEAAVEESPRWGWLEVFLVVQYLSTGLLFLPGAQSIRFVIRALPYASSLGLLVFEWFKLPPRKRNVRGSTGRNALKDHLDASASGGVSEAEARPPAGQHWVKWALVLLTINLLHPATAFPAGPAQVVFQLCIAAPLFWVWKEVKSVGHLQRLIRLMFFSNALSVIVGLLQIYYPQYFMPPEFSRMDMVVDKYGYNRIQALTYVGADGRQIIRPPGLSDVPGGASVAGMTVGFMGIVLASQIGGKWWQRLSCLALAGAGVFVLYLTQVRSLLIMIVVALVAMCFVLWKQKRVAQLVAIASIGASLIVGTFLWAISVGGKSVADRFLGITEEGAVASYQKNRGIFLEHTLKNLLFEYPLGAGVGRWGMMRVYFPSHDPRQSEAPWVEIQVTGWLLDGGVLMWVFYGGAIVAAMLACYRVVIQHAKTQLSYLGGIMFCLELFIVGQSFGSVVFNTQLGIQFWFMVAALHGVASRTPLPLEEPAANKVQLWHRPKAPRAAPGTCRSPKAQD